MAHVPHLLLPGPWLGRVLAPSGEQTRHISKVLRLSDRDPVTYTDGAGTRGTGRLIGGEVERGVEEQVPRPPEIRLAVAPPNSRQRLRFLVEKLAELQVDRLSWVRTARTEGRPPRADKAVAWAVSALEQSRGAWLMEIDSTSLEELAEPLVAADPAGEDEWPPAPLTILIGPEGGLEPAEIPVGASQVSLGRTVLRVETAAVVAATLASHFPQS